MHCYFLESSGFSIIVLFFQIICIQQFFHVYYWRALESSCVGKLDFILFLISNICFSLSLFVNLFAKFNQRFPRLHSKDSRSNFARPCWYPQYFSLRIILTAVFWTRSKSHLVSSLKLLCKTVEDCPRMLLIKRIKISLRFSSGGLKLATLLNSSLHLLSSQYIWDEIFLRKFWYALL